MLFACFIRQCYLLTTKHTEGLLSISTHLYSSNFLSFLVLFPSACVGECVLLSLCHNLNDCTLLYSILLPAPLYEIVDTTVLCVTFVSDQASFKENIVRLVHVMDDTRVILKTWDIWTCFV